MQPLRAAQLERWLLAKRIAVLGKGELGLLTSLELGPALNGRRGDHDVTPKQYER